MKSTQLQRLLPSFSTSYERKGHKQIKCSSMPTCSIGTNTLRTASGRAVWINSINDSRLVLDRAKLMPSLTECRRRVYPLVRCQFSSSDNLNGKTTPEIFTRRTEQPFDQRKDMFIKSIGDPNSVFHPRSVRSELVHLALPAIVGQAIDPSAQLMETAFVGRLEGWFLIRHFVEAEELIKNQIFRNKLLLHGDSAH